MLIRLVFVSTICGTVFIKYERRYDVHKDHKCKTVNEAWTEQLPDLGEEESKDCRACSSLQDEIKLVITAKLSVCVKRNQMSLLNNGYEIVVKAFFDIDRSRDSEQAYIPWCNAMIIADTKGLATSAKPEMDPEAHDV